MSRKRRDKKKQKKKEVKYSLIEFPDGLMVIPSSWIKDNKYVWYPRGYNSKTINSLILEGEKPNKKNWEELQYNRNFGDFGKYNKKSAFYLPIR